MKILTREVASVGRNVLAVVSKRNFTDPPLYGWKTDFDVCFCQKGFWWQHIRHVKKTLVTLGGAWRHMCGH